MALPNAQAVAYDVQRARPSDNLAWGLTRDFGHHRGREEDAVEANRRVQEVQVGGPTGFDA